MAYRAKNTRVNCISPRFATISTFLLLCESEIVLRGWLIEREIFKITTISVFLLSVKTNLLCIDGL